MIIRPWRLSQSAYACMLDDCAVFLDLNTGAYLSLQGVADTLQINANSRSVTTTDPELASELLEADLIERLDDGDEPARQNYVFPAPARDLSLARIVGGMRPSVSDIFLILADAILIYRRASLGALVRHVGRTRPSKARPPAANQEIASRVRAFEEALAYVPFQGECLYRAFLLLMHLRRGGIDARWVFGVRTWPFSAHCWLQAGDLVLNDTVDQLVAFTPILIV